jgi:hypothetical protein
LASLFLSVYCKFTLGYAVGKAPGNYPEIGVVFKVAFQAWKPCHNFIGFSVSVGHFYGSDNSATVGKDNREPVLGFNAYHPGFSTDGRFSEKGVL